MRIAITGGGTGGHVFPALEIARHAASHGHEVHYFGSLRGQEQAACSLAGVPFEGFASEPLVSLKTWRGWRAAARLLRATVRARRFLAAWNPDALFSTGGYSSAPVVASARRLRVPYVVHEQNSVPGRTNLLLSRGAACVATTFEATETHFVGRRVERTGLPVREDLRRVAPAEPDAGQILVVGGSQGASAVNEAASKAAEILGEGYHWMQVTGRANYERLSGIVSGPRARVVPFLESADMGRAYRSSWLVIGRSGAGTMSELAAFRLPSVLVPYPFAHAQHQLYNAKEFEDMGAADVLRQEELDPERLARAIRNWEDAKRRLDAETALAVWDSPDASERILTLVEQAAEGRL